MNMYNECVFFVFDMNKWLILLYIEERKSERYNIVKIKHHFYFKYFCRVCKLQLLFNAFIVMDVDGMGNRQFIIIDCLTNKYNH